jgi:hypothetical protein
MERRVDETLDLENAMNTLRDIGSGKINGSSGMQAPITTRWLATINSEARVMRPEVVAPPPSFRYTVWQRDGRRPASEWSVVETNIVHSVDAGKTEAEKVAKSFLENQDVFISPVEWEEVPA